MLVHLRTEAERRWVHHLRDQAEEWLRSKGIDQYQVSERAKLAHGDIDKRFDRGEFVGWMVDGDIKAVVALTSHDPDFWTAEEMDDPVVYISRFLVAEHGRGWGAQLLAAIIEREAQRGARYVRLDCWKTNTQLHEHYKRQGFTHLRTEEVPGRMSGALFQRPI